MSKKDTMTGSHFEDIVGTIIERSYQKNKLSIRSQVNVGIKPGGGRHFVDYEVTFNNLIDSSLDKKGLISCKVQNTTGTAEEKIAYEVIKLLDIMNKYPIYTHAWIILGGDGWSPGMKTFILGELIPNWFPTYREKLSIYDTNQLITMGINL